MLRKYQTYLGSLAVQAIHFKGVEKVERRVARVMRQPLHLREAWSEMMVLSEENYNWRRR